MLILLYPETIVCQNFNDHLEIIQVALITALYELS